MDVISTQAKRCHTVNAWTLFNGKVLLVKHKKLGIWLAPGGHVEENELPHRAAEREFLEETGQNARVVSSQDLGLRGNSSEYLPLPFYCNLHEINKPRGDSFCEQHYSWGYFVEIVEDRPLDDSDDGIDGVGWFGPEEIDALETTDDIREEAGYVFSHFPSRLDQV